jgi:PKD domain
MNRNSLLAGSLLFVAAAVVGSLIMGAAGVGAQTTSPVACSAPTYMFPAGQGVTLSATGGNGSYTWSSPGLVITNPTGSSFTVTFNRAGTYPVTVASAGASSTCTLTVTAATTGGGTTTGTPGLPNTGELPE